MSMRNLRPQLTSARYTIGRICEISLNGAGGDHQALREDVVRCCTKIAQPEVLIGVLDMASTESIHVICQAVRCLFASHSFEVLCP